MELLIFIFVTYFVVTIFSKKHDKNYYSSSNPKQKYSNYIMPDELEKTKKGKVRRKQTSQYRPSQYKKKPKVSPESYLDPISWNKFEICETCGSENRSKVVCCN